MPSMAESRCGAFAAALAGKLYVCGGGSSDRGSVHKSVECYDPKEGVHGTWHMVAPMSTSRFAHADAVWAGFLYVCGGSSDPKGWDTGLRSVERFQPRWMRWTRVTPMLGPRYTSSAVVFKSNLFVCGGARGEKVVLASVEKLDLATNLWEEVAPLPAPRCWHSAAVVGGVIHI